MTGQPDEEIFSQMGPLERMLAILIAIENAVKTLKTTEMTNEEYYEFMKQLDPTGVVIGKKKDAETMALPEKERLPYLRFITSGIIAQMAREMGDLDFLTKYEVMEFQGPDEFVPFPDKHFLFLLQEGLRYYFREKGRIESDAAKLKLEGLDKWVKAFLEEAELPWEADETPVFASMLEQGFETAPWRHIPINEAINMTGFAVRTFLVSNIEAFNLDKDTLPEVVQMCTPFAFFLTVSEGIFGCVVDHLLKGRSVFQGREDPDGSGMFAVSIVEGADLSDTMWGVG
jgi:hypothetical protein